MTTRDDDSRSDPRHTTGGSGSGSEAGERAGDRSDRGPYDERGEPGRRRRRRRHHHHHRSGRKEKVLHTRISEQLADDIRRLADDLRVPASNLVRNVLEEVFTMVESVSEDVGELFDDVLDEAEEARERVRRRSARRRRRHEQERAPDADRTRRFDGWVERELGPEDGGREPFSARPPDEAASHASSTRAPDPLADVMGWQRLVLNHDRRCARCGVALPRGTEACMGMTSRGLVDTAVCPRCAGLSD